MGTYIPKDIIYTRRGGLEKADHHVVIIDLHASKTVRIINLYRSFRPNDGISPESLFNSQLDLVKRSLSKNCILMGDFNLDLNMERRLDHCKRTYLMSYLYHTCWKKIIKKDSKLKSLYRWLCLIIRQFLTFS